MTLNSLTRTAGKALQSPRLTSSAATIALAMTASLVAVVTARMLGPGDRGVVVILTTTTTIILLLGSLGCGTGMRILMTADDPLDARTAASFAGRVVLYAAPVSVLVGVPILIVSGGGVRPVLWLTFIALTAAQLFNYQAREIVHGAGHHVVAVAGEIVANVFLLLVVAGSWLVGVLSLWVVAAGLLSGSLIQSILLLAVIWRLSAPRTSSWTLAQVVARSRAVYVSALGQAVVNRGDRLVLGFAAGSASVGIYGAAATLTELISLVPLAVSQVAFRRAGATRKVREAISGLTGYAVGTMLLALLIGVGARPIVDFLLGSSYASAVTAVRILCVAAVFFGCHLVMSAVLNGLGHVNATRRATLGGVITLAVGAPLLIPPFGGTGAAATSCLSYAVMALISTRFVVRLGRT